MKLPALIDRLYRIVKLQQADCRRAIYGEGNYELAPWMKKHKVSSMQWKMKTEEEKEQLFKRFMAGLPTKKKQVISTDGRLSIPRTPTIARKPGQKKRVRNIRRTKRSLLYQHRLSASLVNTYSLYYYHFITPPARRAWRSYKFASLDFPVFFFFRCRKLGCRSWAIPLAPSCMSPSKHGV